MSSWRQSTASRAGAAASSVSTAVPMPPPVSTSDAPARRGLDVHQLGDQPGRDRLGQQARVVVNEYLRRAHRG